MTYIPKSKRLEASKSTAARKIVLEIEVSDPEITHATIKDVVLTVSPEKTRVFQQAVDRFTLWKDGEMLFGAPSQRAKVMQAGY